MKPKLKELLFVSFTIEHYHPFATQKLILNALLFIIALIALILIPMNYFLTHTPSLIFVDIILFTLSLYALYQLRQKGNYHLAAWIGSTMLFGVFMILIHLYQGKDFSLV